MSTLENTGDVTEPAAVAGPADVETSAIRAAQAIATLLPATSDLTVGLVQPPALVDFGAWAGAAGAPLAGARGGTVAVLVGAELVTALASSPMGPLELGAAVQPSIDAAAAALGTTAGAAHSLDGDEVSALAKDADFAVPLLADGVTAAVLLVALAAPAASSAPVDSFTPSATVAPSASASSFQGSAPRRGIELLHGVAMDVTVELGRTRLSVRELLALAPGDVLELDRAAGSPADLLVNGRLIARGEVVVVDENYALRVTEIVANSPVS
jgi:flagellar motor switch protein FliN/FliY